MKKLLGSPILILAIIGLFAGIFFAALENFDFIPSWYKLPLVPAQPTKITNVELGNIIIKTNNNKAYRCATEGDECWTENLELTVPSWWENHGWERYFREYDSCDYSKPYFATWRFSTENIIDCLHEREVFVDWGVTTIVLIDQEGHVWQHTYSFSAIASNTAIVIFPILCTFGGLILGICVMALRTILQKMRLRKAESAVSTDD
jgi:hypothetical protein